MTLKLFPTQIYHMTVFDKESNQKLLKNLEELRATIKNSKPDTWNCNLYTTFMHNSRLHENSWMKELISLVEKHTNLFAKEMGVLEEFEVTDSWFNVYEDAGDAQDIHNHGGYDFSAVYYPYATEKSGKIIFYSPNELEVYTPLHYKDWDINNTLSYKIQPETGSLIIFRSWLKHGVQPSGLSGDGRTSIAFNLNARKLSF